MAQTQAMGHHQNLLEVPHWAREMCNRAQEAEVRMASRERVFQAAQLFYLDNCRVIDRLEGGMESFHNQWSKVMDLRRTVEDQARTILDLEICLAQLERRARCRSSGSSSLGPLFQSALSSLGSSTQSVVIGVGTWDKPCKILELEEDKVVSIPVPPPCRGRRSDRSRWEGTDEELCDPSEIIQVNSDEDLLPVIFQRGMPFGLDEEGAIIAQNELPSYDNPPEYDDVPDYL